MDEVKNISFKEFIVLQRGFDLPKKKINGGPYPVIGSTSILGYHNEYKVEPPGVVTGRSGSLGFVQYTSDRYWPHNTALWVRDFKGNLPRYVYYCLQTLDLNRFNSGVGVPTLNRNDLDTLEVAIPTLPIQRKIAAILSAYDDLIENNAHRIGILEQMAQSVYREWFGTFRFPGHEKIRTVDSKLGKIPEGWEITAIGNVADIHRGRSYRSKNLVEVGGIPFINLKCIERNGGFRADGLKSYSGPFSESQTVSVNDIVVAVTDMTQERRLVAHAARIPCLSYGYAIYSMDLVKLKPKRTNWQEYLYGILRYSDFSDTVKQMANGVNVLHLSPLHIGTFEFVMAPQNVVETYSEMLRPIYELENNLEMKSMYLRQTRDLLLPRLISGDLDVSDLDISTNDTDGGSQ